MTTRFTDLFDQGGGTWSATNWTTSVTGTSATIAMAAGERGSITLPNGSARYVYAIDKYTATANQEVLVQVSGDQSVTRNNFVVIGVAMSGITGGRPSTPTDGVYLKIAGNTNTFALNHVHGGTITNGPTLTASRAAFNSTFWVRLQHVNGIVKVKTWTDGSAEPGTWNDTVDISSYAALPAGNAVLGAETTSSSSAAETYYFDSVTSTDGINSTPVTYNAQPITASVTMPGGTGGGNVKVIPVTEDSYVDTLNSTNYGTQTTLTVGANKEIWVKIPAVSLNAGEFTASPKLVLTAAGAWSALTLSVYAVNSDWAETTITGQSRPASTFIKGVSVPALASGEKFSIDLSDVDTTYGVRLSNNGLTGYSFYSAEGTTPPLFTYMLGTVTNANVSATPMTASVSMPDPLITTQTGLSVSAQPMTADVAIVNPAVSAEQFIDVTVSVAPMTASASMPAGSGFSVPATVSAQPMTATAEVVGGSVAVTRSKTIKATPLAATISLVQAALVNDQPIIPNESDDTYFARIYGRTPYKYFRLNEPNGVTTAADRMGNATTNPGLIYHGVTTGLHQGPNNRASVYFDGGAYIEQNEGPTGDEGSLANASFEFSFRTDKSEQFIFSQSDGDRTSLVNELWMIGGKLVYRNLPGDSRTTGPTREMTGRRNLADGEWHTVFIRNFNGFNGGGAEIWVDGTFEVRRYGVAALTGFPDFIGARYEQYDWVYESPLPSNEYFVGDMSELVMFAPAANTSLRSDELSKDYYAFMGWAPISVEPMAATAELVKPVAKGNQKKALYLYWWTEREGIRSPRTDSVGNQIDFDPIPQFVYPGMHDENVTDYHGFKVFSRPIVSGPYSNYNNYRDQWTDEPALIDLTKDIDLSDFDVILFKDWPDEGSELDFVETNFPGQKDRLLSQLRDANDAGIGLYVTHPRLAIDLGIVDDVEFVLPLQEFRNGNGQGNAGNVFDYASAAKFPWNIDASDGLFSRGIAIGTGQAMNTDPSYLLNKAYFYNDTHANNRFRVRALVDNLTDIPSYMIDEAVFHADSDGFGNQGIAMKYLHRMNGLQIGDEYIFNGSNIIAARFEEEVDFRYQRYNGTWATPGGHVKAGTVVTTFGAKHWLGTQEVDNPYKDYATTIVVQPGDVLNGREAKGKIFVNFTEAPSNGLGLVVQKTPNVDPNAYWPQGYTPETSAQAEWEYSWTRTSTTKSAQQNTQQVTMTMPDGSLVNISVAAPSNNLVMVRTGEIWPVEAKPRWEMDGRGMFWLSVKDTVADGDAVIKAQPLTATAEVAQPEVTAQHDAEINAPAMVAQVTLVKPLEDQTGDVTVLALPMTASVAFTGNGKTIFAEPMTATVELVDNFDMVHAQGEQVVLTLHGYDATLFIKEEA